MTWFKVDDGFYDHPKVESLDMAARGLWVSAGAYCARHLTDGVITGRQVRLIGGTAKQAEKLVASGLWSADDAPPSARRYTFNDWRDFQPSRADVTRRRNDDAERKREARAQKQAKQDRYKNVRSDVHLDVQEDALSNVRAPSALPDPTRPDPTRKREKGKEKSGTIQPDNTTTTPPSSSEFEPTGTSFRAFGSPADPRCAKHKDIPRDQVPACRDCQTARQWWKQQDENERNWRKSIISDCHWCDDNGMANVHDESGRPVVVRCNHDPHTPPEAPAAPEVFKPLRTKRTKEPRF